MLGTILCSTCEAVLGTLEKPEITQADANDLAGSECDNGHATLVIQLEDETLLTPE